jgi:oxaloacetate decarboxylase gamma subunit
MTIIEMLQQSAVLTVLGMTVVFVFLWIMIICINWIGKLVHTLKLDKDIQAPENEHPTSAGGSVKPEITAAITGAVTEFRKKERDHE